MDKLTPKNVQVPIPEAVREEIVKARRIWGRQAQIARTTGVSKETLRRITIGQQKKIEAPSLATLAAELGIDLSDVEDAVMPRTWVLPEEFDLVPDEERDHAIRFLRWALNTRDRVARERALAVSDAVARGDLPGGGGRAPAGG